MKINQVNFAYVAREDRLLFRFNTLDKVEFRMWLTRAKSIVLLELLDQSVKCNLQQQSRKNLAVAQPSMQAMMEFQRDAALSNADYKSAYSDQVVSFALGEQPILVTDVALDSSPAVPSLSFVLVSGQSVGLSLNHELALAVGKLLSDVLGKTDWGVGSAQKITIFNSNPAESMAVH